jgi:hypothetical protein
MRTITVKTPHQFKMYYKDTVFLHELQRWLMKNHYKDQSSGIWCFVKVLRCFRVTCCLHLDARQKEARFFPQDVYKHIFTWLNSVHFRKTAIISVRLF